jgi:hypothetical protein
VAKADLSTVGRTGSLMTLWTRLWDSRGGVHRVAPEAVSEVKAQTEAKFPMY